MKFKIYRFNPETDKKPYIQQYELDDVEPGTMLLMGMGLLGLGVVGRRRLK